MRKKIMMMIAFVLMFTMVSGTGAVYAAQVGQQDYNEVQQQIDQEKKLLEEGKAEEQNLAKEIQELETKINTAENQVAILQSQIAETEEKVATAQAELEEAQQNIDAQDANLNVRLRAMYKNGSIGFLDVLLGSGSISEFISNMDMVQKVHESDKKVLVQLKDDYKIVKEKKKELDSLQSQLNSQKKQEEKKQEELSVAKSEVTKKKANVAATNEARQDNIQDLNEEADHIMAIIIADAKKKEEEERQKREEEKKRQQQQAQSGNQGSSDKSDDDSGSTGEDDSSSSGSGGGGFSWPVPGHTRISSNYGWRICPFHGREKHTGIDIPAPYGTSVKAADSGTVIYAGYLGSYGNAVIIRHSSTLYTLYAHNSSLVVGSGKKVSRGQTVSKIGSTGSSTGNHLHFEVRKGGNSYGNDVNPWNYL